MIPVPMFNTGDTLRAADLTTLANAVIELQTQSQSGGAAAVTSQAPIPDDPPFDVYEKVLLASVNSDGTWSEMNVVGGSVVTFGTPGTDGRQCTSAGDPSKVIKLTGTQAVLLEVGDPPDKRYVLIGTAPLVVPSNPLDLTYSTTHAEATGQTYDAAFDLTALPSHSPAYDGVKYSQTVGVSYYDPGDQTIYEYRRDILIDLQGRIVQAGAAYRITVVQTCASGG